MRSHDAVAVEPFTRLSRMPSYAVERHEPDPRGWTVVNGLGKKVGEVRDLIVDTNRMTARYLDVELDTKLFDWRGDDPHILVPVERAHIDGKHLVVQDISETWVADMRAHRTAHVHQFWDRWWTRERRRATVETPIAVEVRP
jgi:sporulation protein YlmC with PRC-barrel domain